MKKSWLFKLTILLLLGSTLSGCLWVEPKGLYLPGDSPGQGSHRGRH